MTKEKYRKILIITTGIIGGGTALGVIINNSIIPIIIIALGIMVLFYSKSRVKGVVQDERNHKIGGYAGRYAISLYSLISAITGLILITRDSQVANAVAQTLFGSISVLILCYLLLYSYFNRKM